MLGALLLGVLATGPAAATAAPAPPAPVRVELAFVKGLAAVEPNPQPLSRETSGAPPAGLDVSALPAGTWVHGAAPITSDEALAFAASRDRAVLYFDGDGDRVLEPSERHEGSATSPGIAWFDVLGRVHQRDAAGDHAAMIPMRVGLSPDVPPRSFNRLDAYREGVLRLGDRTARIAVVDRTFRGWFSHLGRDALLVDVDGDGAWEVGEDSHERYRLGAPFPLGDVDLVVASVAPLGEAVTVSRSERPARRMASLAVGAPAPGFEATLLDGTTFRLAAQRGSWVLLDFWATWCAPCRAEVPGLKKLRETEPGVVVLGVSGDRQRAALEAFVRSEGVTWPQVFDEAGAIAATYRVRTLPRSFLVAPDGTIAARDVRGPALPDTVRRLVDAARPR
jgi:peroxiredoxin